MWRRYSLLPHQVLLRETGYTGYLFCDKIIIRTCIDDLSAMHSCTRPYVNDVICLADDFFFVLDDYDSIAKVAQLMQDIEQLSCVFWMKSDTRFVKYV